MKSWKTRMILTLAALATSFAHAEGRDGGGGVGFLCHEAGQEKVYLADTYSLVKQGRLKDFANVDIGTILLAAAQRIGEKAEPDRKDYSLLAMELSVKNYAQKWVPEKSLALLGDDHIQPSQIPPHCEKVQLVIQDIATRTLHYNKTLVNKLSRVEYNFLSLHETLINVRNQPGADTTPIRAQVASVIDSNEFGEIVKWVADANSLLDVKSPANDKYKAMIALLPGEYTGQDPMKNPCHVTIKRQGDKMTFAMEVTYTNGSIGKETPPAISIDRLAAKFNEDTEWRKTQPDFSDTNLNVNYYLEQSHATLLGVFQTATGSVELQWYKNQFSTVTLADHVGDNGLMCFIPTGD